MFFLDENKSMGIFLPFRKCSDHGIVCLLYSPILLLEPKIFDGVLVFVDRLFRGKVFD